MSPLKRYGILAACAAVVVAIAVWSDDFKEQKPQCTSAIPVTLRYDLDRVTFSKQNAVRFINAWREKNLLPRVAEVKDLSVLAHDYAQTLAECSGYISSPKKPWNRLVVFATDKTSFTAAWGEMVQKFPDKVANRSVAEVGVGMVKGDYPYHTYWVVVLRVK